MTDKETIIKIKEAVAAARTAAVFSHIRPDGDTVGSALALRCFLMRLGKRVDVFCEDKIPEKYLVLDGADKFRRAPGGEYDLAVTADVSAPERLGIFAAEFGKVKNNICIDHHAASNTRYAALNLVSRDASCTETVYKVIKALGGKLDKELARYIYTGLVTDTGGFLQSNTTAKTLTLAAECLKTGLDFAPLAFAVYRSSSKIKFDLKRRALNNIEFFEGGKIAAVTFTKKDFAECGADLSDTEGVINEALCIDGVEAALSVAETARGALKVSVRSRARADANEICGVFGGGGHNKAAGCMLFCGVGEAVAKLVRETARRL